MKHLHVASLVITITLAISLTWFSFSPISKSFSTFVTQSYRFGPVVSTNPITSHIRIVSGILQIQKNASPVILLTTRSRFSFSQVAPTWNPDRSSLMVLSNTKALKLSSESNWLLELPTTNRHCIFIQNKTANLALNLSAIPICALNVQSNATQLTLEINQPNPVKMATFQLFSKASDTKIYGLSNANCATTDIKVGVGRLWIELGPTKPKVNNTIQIGGKLSKMIIYVPRGFNGIINKSSHPLVSISAPRFYQVSGECFQSAAFNPKKQFTTLNIRIQSGRASIIEH